MTIDQIIAITGIAIPSIISIISLWVSAKTRTKLNASRVEVGNESSNEDHKTPSWQMWVDTPHGSTTTKYFGLKKNIVFSEPFKSVPTVSSALSLVNTKTIEELVAQNIIQIEDIPQHETNRLEIHVVTFAVSVTKEGFELQVGLGAPALIGTSIINFLKSRTLTETEIDEAITFNHVKSRSPNDITQDESWVLNFYYIIGTIDITWIAQAKAAGN